MKELNRLTLTIAAAVLFAAFSPAAHGASGTPLWTNFYDGPVGPAAPYAVGADSQGNVIVTGLAAGGGGVLEFATVKYSGAGVPLWTNHFPYGVCDGFSGQTPVMAVGSNGNVFVSGASSRPLGLMDFATVAYSGSGLPLWTNFYSPPESVYNVPHALAVDSPGNVFGHFVRRLR